MLLNERKIVVRELTLQRLLAIESAAKNVLSVIVDLSPADRPPHLKLEFASKEAMGIFMGSLQELNVVLTTE
jgi:hypothetical protein